MDCWTAPARSTADRDPVPAAAQRIARELSQPGRAPGLGSCSPCPRAGALHPWTHESP
jgi:hypothetical protein